MPKQKQSAGKSRKTDFVIGQASFAKVSAVEGIQLTPAMKTRVAKAVDRKLSAEERREMIVRAYRKA